MVSKAGSVTLIADPSPLEPIWPLPRRAGGLSDEQIREAFARFPELHYAYAFEGGLSFSTRYVKSPPNFNPERPLQRFRHFMPHVVASQQGSLAGKRVLDIACNAGFWSIQCALLGADVVGFDGRPELIEQANLVKSIVGLNNITFSVLDFWDMNPKTLGGTFDLVLSLGILYHLPEPLAALQRTKAMARETILLDTGVYPSQDALVLLHWEEPDDIRRATQPGIVARPSKKSIELMLRHIGFADWYEIPLLSTDMPGVYLQEKRASWLIEV